MRNMAPLKMLAKALNNKVLVKLKDGSEYVGILYRYDNTMNVVLIDAVEISGGRVDPPVAKFGKIMIRGSNVLYIALDFDQVSKGET